MTQRPKQTSTNEEFQTHGHQQSVYNALRLMGLLQQQFMFHSQNMDDLRKFDRGAFQFLQLTHLYLELVDVQFEKSRKLN